jgi:DNA/RNA endonuclease G (NUC1)
MKAQIRSSVASLLTTLACIVAFLACISPARAIIGTTYQMQLGNPTGATSDPNNHSHYLIQRTVEAMDYNDTLGQPNWTSWDLTAADIGSVTRSTTFYTDTNLPAGFHRVTTAEYTNTGFDRGHMCPSDDRTDTTNDNKTVFFMSNIVPQQDDLNTGPWEALETYCRSLTTSNYEPLIISGPVGFDGTKLNTGYVSVPGYTWKIVVCVPPGTGTALSRITATTRVIAVKMPNIIGIHAIKWTNYITCVNRIQYDTGYTFLSALSSTIANSLRAYVDGGVDHYPITGGGGSVTISQVYGGGGNSGATYKNDFIEIYNNGATTVDLSTYAVQYASATSSTWSETLLTGSIAPGAHYLIQEAAGAGGTLNLPTPQVTGSIALAATAGKVALTKTQTLLAVDNPVGNSDVVDFIGYGTTADAFEGAGPAPAPSNTTADLRAANGATDTNNNSTDFSAGSPNPRNN